MGIEEKKLCETHKKFSENTCTLIFKRFFLNILVFKRLNIHPLAFERLSFNILVLKRLTIYTLISK